MVILLVISVYTELRPFNFLRCGEAARVWKKLRVVQPGQLASAAKGVMILHSAIKLARVGWDGCWCLRVDKRLLSGGE